jgi:hypothetical protein
MTEMALAPIYQRPKTAKVCRAELKDKKHTKPRREKAARHARDGELGVWEQVAPLRWSNILSFVVLAACREKPES